MENFVYYMHIPGNKHSGHSKLLHVKDHDRGDCVCIDDLNRLLRGKNL